MIFIGVQTQFYYPSCGMIAVIFLDLSLGQSYIYGKAFYRDKTYFINIQYGSRSIMLPYEIINHSKYALIEFYRQNGSKVTLEHRVDVSSKDIIEIYDDWLTNELANDLPIEMHIRLNR